MYLWVTVKQLHCSQSMYWFLVLHVNTRMQCSSKLDRKCSQLRSFLGLINYYGKFIPKLSTVLHPLNTLLQKGRTWKRSPECAQAFQLAKDELTSSMVLAHYNLDLPIKLTADASAYGVGAVFSHVLPDGSEHPVTFASRTLTPSEQNYAHIEEALALIFGVKMFHTFLYG